MCSSDLDPGVDEEPILVDQIQPVQLGRQLAAAQQHAAGVLSSSLCAPVRRSPFRGGFRLDLLKGDPPWERRRVTLPETVGRRSRQRASGEGNVRSALLTSPYVRQAPLVSRIWTCHADKPTRVVGAGRSFRPWGSCASRVGVYDRV